MIVLDIETSGLDHDKCGVISIGALCFDEPEKTFYQECKIDDDEEVQEGAMKINGLSEEEMRDKNKQSQKQLINNFYRWHIQINGKFLLDENRENAMGLSRILEFCGIPDKRIGLKESEVEKEGESHNALEDARLEAECFSRLIYGKRLFSEFKRYPIPEELAK